jgi:hypothetical protein
MTNPFKAVMSVRRQELPFALLMFTYFFLVIASFWVLKPMKKTLFLSYYDQTGFDLFTWHLTAAQAELLAKVLNMVVAFLAVTVFTLAVRRLHRQQLTLLFSVFSTACYILFSLVINQPTGITVWAFFLFGDLFNTLMVATFFAFLNDSVTPDAAKRMYGLVGLGGVAGGVFGTTTLSVWIDRVDPAAWMWICLGAAVLIVVVSQLAGRMVDRNPPPEIETPEPEQTTSEQATAGDNPAIEGARLVFRSPYLLAIVGIVGFYEIVSTIMDFQFSATIAHYLDGPDIGRQVTLVFTITNWTSMLVQLFLTSYIMTRFGLTVHHHELDVDAGAAVPDELHHDALWLDGGAPDAARGCVCRVGHVHGVTHPLGRQLAQHCGQRFQLLHQPVGEGSAVRTDHARGEVQGQGVHRHVRATVRQGSGGGYHPGHHDDLCGLLQRTLVVAGHDPDPVRLDHCSPLRWP